MRATIRTAAVTLFTVASLFARAADPVAFVSDFKGEVVLNGAGRPAFLAELLPGSTLALGERATASVMYVVSGVEYAIKGPGEFLAGREGVTAVRGSPPTSRVPPLRASERVLVRTSRTATASLRMRSAPVPRAAKAGPVYPLDARIANLQPTLRWMGEPGAEYSIVVSTAAGQEVHRGKSRGLSLRLPQRLEAGRAYSWSVSLGEKALGEARFETLGSDVVASAERARAGAKGFADRVLLALVLQDLGASQDSREVWAELAAERPDIPELAGLSR